jgi:hypothetical protein
MSWKFNGSRVKGSVNAVTIHGLQLSSNQTKAHYGGAITRHHIIDIQSLQAFWNATIDRDDDDTMEALACWANATPLLPAKPRHMQTTQPPNGLLKSIAWNPLNLIVGPPTEYRLGDPANDFDDIHFRSFPSRSASPDALSESIVRQEFNMHVRRLRRIFLLIEEYLNGPLPDPTLESLRSLLRSDVIANYPKMSNKMGAAIQSGCALLHPALWRDYTSEAKHGFAKGSDQKKFNNATHAGMIPYASDSFFPEIQITPKNQQHQLLEEIKVPPTGEALVRIPSSERKLLERSTCLGLLQSKLQPITRFMTGSGLRVFICSPSASAIFGDITANVGAVLAELISAHPTWRVTYVPMVRPIYLSCEVRIYPR